MKRGLIALAMAVAAVAVAGCDIAAKNNLYSAADYAKSESHFTTVCLDGVEYWIRAAGHRGYLAVRMDPATLTPRHCRK